MHFSDVLLIGKAAEDAVREQKYGTHADEIETSMILYMRPGTVRMEQAVADGGHAAACRRARAGSREERALRAVGRLRRRDARELAQGSGSSAGRDGSAGRHRRAGPRLPCRREAAFAAGRADRG